MAHPPRRTSVSPTRPRRLSSLSPRPRQRNTPVSPQQTPSPFDGCSFRRLSSSSVTSSTSEKDTYKTELCSPFTETGQCRYGAKCLFAHGPSEVRPIARHPKYKTEPCKNFSRDGNCSYGSRCRFIHQESPEELSELACQSAGNSCMIHGPPFVLDVATSPHATSPHALTSNPSSPRRYHQQPVPNSVPNPRPPNVRPRRATSLSPRNRASPVRARRASQLSDERNPSVPLSPLSGQRPLTNYPAIVARHETCVCILCQALPSTPREDLAFEYLDSKDYPGKDYRSRRSASLSALNTSYLVPHRSRSPPQKQGPPPTRSSGSGIQAGSPFRSLLGTSVTSPISSSISPPASPPKASSLYRKSARRMDNGYRRRHSGEPQQLSSSNQRWYETYDGPISRYRSPSPTITDCSRSPPRSPPRIPPLSPLLSRLSPPQSMYLNNDAQLDLLAVDELDEMRLLSLAPRSLAPRG